MAADLSGISYLVPILSFIFAFVVVYAVLNKTKILGEEKAIQAIVGIVISLIFVSFFQIRTLIENVTPWFVLLTFLMFFVIFFAAFMLKDPGVLLKPWIVWIFIVLILIVFLTQGAAVFGASSASASGDSTVSTLKHVLSSGKVAGGIWIIFFAAIVGFTITRKW